MPLQESTCEETNNNDDVTVSHEDIMPKKYVAVRGYTKKEGDVTVRVRPHIRKITPSKITRKRK